MNNERFSSGAFVFTRARGLEPRLPKDLHPLATRHQIEPAFIPEYSGDRTAIGRAISQASSGLHREGFLLRPIKRTTAEVVYGIVREQRDEADQRVDHDFEATVAWSSEPDPSVVRGEHPVAQRVADAYGELRGKITAEDWSSVIVAYLEAHDAARVRGDGRVYWVPPQRLDEVRRFGAFLAEVGIDLVLCEIESESRAVVEQVAAESLDEQLDRLQSEAEQFDGTQKPSTYARRLDEYQRLRERAMLYRSALGVGVDRATQVLNELHHRVGTMLDLRQQTVIHRNGSVDGPAPTSAPAATSPTSLRLAGASFTAAASDDPTVLTFVSDDASAIATVKMLEGMGLAGKWQQAGATQFEIRNSGPPGAAVSVRIRLPQSGSLKIAAQALAAVGVELS
jgi:hypothetical protein